MAFLDEAESLWASFSGAFVQNADALVRNLKPLWDQLSLKENPPIWIPLLAALTPVVVAGATFFLARRQRQSQMRQNALEFSRLLTEPDFKMKVTVVAWRAMTKWRWWHSDDAIRYKALICWTYLGWESRYRNFDPAHLKDYQIPVPQGVTHFQPDPTPETNLSEHDALTVWLETWSQLAIMLDNGLADKDTAAALLATQFSYWLPIIVQIDDVFTDVCRMLKSQRQIDQQPPAWMKQLAWLRTIFRKKDAMFRKELRKAEKLLKTPAYLDEKQKIVATVLAQI